jgi:hypothetical protein
MGQKEDLLCKLSHRLGKVDEFNLPELGARAT